MFKEEEVLKITKKILEDVQEATKEITHKAFEHVERYLYEIYDNVEDNIKDKLIREITEQFKTDPKSYHFKILRDKLFEENKEQIIPLITDEKIKEALDKLIYNYTHTKHPFSWKWEEYVAKVIHENLDEWLEHPRVQSCLLHQIRNAEYLIRSLEEKIRGLED